MHPTNEHIGKRWRLALFATVLLRSVVWMSDAAASDDGVKPISQAKKVFAIYNEDWGLAASDDPVLILALWTDGTMIWSADQIEGGAPYFAAQIEASRVTAFFASIARDGYFENQNLKHARFGPDSHFTTIHMRADDRELKMQSWHERFEMDGGLAATPGITALAGRQRLDVLAKQDPKWLHYRMAWSELRVRALTLVPDGRSQVHGKLVMEAGDVHWVSAESENAATDTRPAAKRLPRLGSATVLQLAIQTAIKQGYDPTDYNMTGCHYQFVQSDNRWTVFFEMKPPTPPGGHFMVSVDDMNKVTELMPGE